MLIRKTRFVVEVYRAIVAITVDRVISNYVAGVRDDRNERNARNLDIWASFNQLVWMLNIGLVWYTSDLLEC